MRTAVLSTAAAALALAGCATIVTGGDDEIDIVTPGVVGAECELRTFSGAVRARIVTPGTVELSKDSSDLEAICTKDGFIDARGQVDAGFEPWVIGNLLFGGLIGIVIDFVNDSAYKYDSDVAIYMEPGDSGRDALTENNDRGRDTRRLSAGGGQVASATRPRGGDAAVYLGFSRAQELAENTTDFMWTAEDDLLGGTRPVVQQRIDPASGQPRFHIYGADIGQAEASDICAGLDQRGYLCRVVEARR